MRIAIIDGVNQDIGLKILFPEADYFIKRLDENVYERTDSHKKYNIVTNTEWSSINDKNYDYLFIVISLYDTVNTKFYKQEVYDIFQEELAIINNNNFKRVCLFDNYDYDYDPNEYVDNPKIDFFFKRNYNSKKKYNANVVPYPFIMFGKYSLVEKIDKGLCSKTQHINRIFFSGSLFDHRDDEIKYYRNRRDIYNKITNIIYNPGYLPYHLFLQEIQNSKYALDLNGVGDPNIRTFEILSQQTLRIAEYNELYWPFPEKFAEETIFKNADEFIMKMKILSSNDSLYQYCLDVQNNIYKKYFNKEWIRNYVLSTI
jgi:hypothetical protein